jgi:hypothetical protein
MIANIPSTTAAATRPSIGISAGSATGIPQPEDGKILGWRSRAPACPRSMETHMTDIQWKLTRYGLSRWVFAWATALPQRSRPQCAELDLLCGAHI